MAGRNFRRVVIGLCVAVMLASLAGWLLPRSAAADTAIIRPDGDGTITTAAWNASTGSTYFSLINNATTQPTTPPTTTNINTTSKDNGSAFFTMGPIAAAKTTTAVTVWIYHNDTNTSGLFGALYANDETTVLGTEAQFTVRNANTWDSLTFSGLSLTQTQLDGMRVRLRTASSAGASKAKTVYNMYASVTYTAYAVAPVADIVDASEASVASPSVSFGAATTIFSCQTKTATLGVTAQKVHIFNDTNDTNWTLTMAPSGGTTANWTAGGSHYDFNDPSGSPAGCGDGADADSYGGQMSVDPSAGSVTAQAGCTTTGVTKGGATAFSEGAVNNVTLLNGAGAGLACYWDLTGVNMSQTLPGPTAPGSYTLNMVLTATSV